MNMSSTIKSIRSTEKVYVRFINKSLRDASIYWLDFNGVPVKYHTLTPDAYIDIDTFINHPWVFSDNRTGDNLSVNNQFYFFPPCWKMIFQRINPNHTADIPPHRLIVMITLPVFSLKERCMQVLRDNLDLSQNPGLFKALEEQLPKSVLDDLILMFLKKDGFYVN